MTLIEKVVISHELNLTQFSGRNIFIFLEIKGALDKNNIIPKLFQKKLGFLYH